MTARIKAGEHGESVVVNGAYGVFDLGFGIAGERAAERFVSVTKTDPIRCHLNERRLKIDRPCVAVTHGTP